MALRPDRQVKSINIDFQTIATAERGGLLHVGISSGLTIAELVINPSGRVPLGIMYNDVENINPSLQYHPGRLREVSVPYDNVGIMDDGQLETDWVHIVGNVGPGDWAYAGPSGTITNTAAFGGHKVGKFRSILERDPHNVIFAGGGFFTSYMNIVNPHNIIDENNPANRDRKSVV